MARSRLVDDIHRRADEIIVCFEVVEVLGCFARDVCRAVPYHCQVL
jgi:hypothetical protein